VRSQALLLRRTHESRRGPIDGAAAVVIFTVERLAGVDALQVRE
jgi:hypothetical protein